MNAKLFDLLEKTGGLQMPLPRDAGERNILRDARGAGAGGVPGAAAEVAGAVNSPVTPAFAEATGGCGCAPVDSERLAQQQPAVSLVVARHEADRAGRVAVGEEGRIMRVGDVLHIGAHLPAGGVADSSATLAFQTAKPARSCSAFPTANIASCCGR